jgi:hypothetical protein
VTVGAYALHLFTLLRSDLSHLSGPSFLLPLFLLMLPLFAWQCVRPGLGRGALLSEIPRAVDRLEALFPRGFRDGQICRSTEPSGFTPHLSLVAR